jgi:hypothetical protein
MNYRNGMKGQDLFEFAKNKAKSLKNKELIRLFADKNFGFYLYKEGGKAFIGSYVDGTDIEMKPFFIKRKVIFLIDNATGKKEMKFQKL